MNPKSIAEKYNLVPVSSMNEALEERIGHAIVREYGRLYLTDPSFVQDLVSLGFEHVNH